MSYDTITTDVQGSVGRLILSRPERRNALSLGAMTEITNALHAFGSDSEVRAVIIEGDGPAFSAGHDLSEMVDRPSEYYDALFSKCTEMMQAIHAIPQPVIAKVAGIATAAGCQLVASCDLVVAAESATFATPGVKVGLFCTTPMVPVARAVGTKRAMEMLLTGEPIDAETAAAWGLVNRVVPLADLENAVLDLTTTITQYSGAVIGLGKDAFYRQAGVHEDEAYAITEPIMAGSAAAADAQEGFSAFLQKRQPVWTDAGRDETSQGDARREEGGDAS